MKEAQSKGNEDELTRLIGENIDLKEIIRLNNMSETHSCANEETNLTNEDLIKVDELFDQLSDPKEEVKHTINKNGVSYYMEVSGIHAELSKSYADSEENEYILNQKDFNDAAKYIDLDDNEERKVKSVSCLQTRAKSQRGQYQQMRYCHAQCKWTW